MKQSLWHEIRLTLNITLFTSNLCIVYLLLSVSVQGHLYISWFLGAAQHIKLEKLNNKISITWSLRFWRNFCRLRRGWSNLMHIMASHFIAVREALITLWANQVWGFLYHLINETAIPWICPFLSCCTVCQFHIWISLSSKVSRPEKGPIFCAKVSRPERPIFCVS